MKKVLLFIGIGLLLLGIPATVFIVSQQRDVRTKAAPATTLSLTPATQSIPLGGPNFKLNVDIDPGANQVVSANIYITYDPTKLEAKTITNGSAAPRVLNSGVIENGTASIKVGAASNSQPITTRGTIAVITFAAIDATSNFTPAVVQFASNTFVGGLNEPTANVLVGTTPAKITVTGIQANSSGQNFASESATLTPTLTLTLTPTLSPTATPSATATLTPTLTPTLAATDSGQATASALQITTPVEDTSVATDQPVIRGKAAPGSVVTIVIHSDTGITVTVTTDANGNWVYTPTTALAEGPHTVVASAQDAAGTTQTATAAFVVASGAGTDATDASMSGVPVSGNIETTLVLLSIGILLLVSGAIVWHF